MAIKINERAPGTHNGNSIVFGDNRGNRMDFQYFGTNIRLRCGIRCTSLTRNEPAYQNQEPEGMTKISWDHHANGAPTIQATVSDSMTTGSLSLFTRQGGAVKKNVSEIFIRATAAGNEVFVNENPFPKTTCNTCNGTSVVVCSKCNGQGRFARQTNFGTMWDPCFDCKKHGVLMCTDCGPGLITRVFQGGVQRWNDFMLDQGWVGKVNMQNIQLPNADLSAVVLRDTNLKNANLQGAKLDGADLTDADLSGANLEGASLNRANLDNTKFENANMARAQLESTYCLYTIFSNANLTGANFKHAIFADADAYGTNLTNVDFTGSKVKESYWESSGFEGEGDWIHFSGLSTNNQTNQAGVISWPADE